MPDRTIDQHDTFGTNRGVVMVDAEPTHPVSTYPDRWVGFVDSWDDYYDFFVIMLCESRDAAVSMMTEAFGDDWEDNNGRVVTWSRFVRYELSYLQGMHRAYYTGNEGERKTWKHGEPIFTIAELMKACE